jgi:hypothetical protein
MIKPESHDIFESFSGSKTCRSVRSHLPVFGPVKEAVVKSGLTLEEVEHIYAVSVAVTGNIRVITYSLPYRIGPYITV